MQIRFFRDQQHIIRAKGGDALQALAEFLETDIQDPATGKEMLAELEAALNGDTKVELTGNSHSLSVDGKTITIENLFEESSSTLPLAPKDLVQCLRAWVEFLDNEALVVMAPFGGH